MPVGAGGTGVGPGGGNVPPLGAWGTKFPPGGGVLTTGASLTHVGARWSIRLGPHDITPTVLAHEFGHVLGFPDGYFRGYRDHGPEGYQVLEVAPDPEDIMSAPGRGRVRRQHFDRLVAP